MKKFLNKVIEGDCLALLPEIPENSIDMVLCDLPYGHTENGWDEMIDLPALWTQYTRILKPKGSVVLTAAGAFTGKLIVSNLDWFKYKIVWIKSTATNFLNANKQPLRKHEDICVFYPEQPTYHPQMTAGSPYEKGIRSNTATGSYRYFKPTRITNPSGLRYPVDIISYEEEIPDYLYTKTAEAEGATMHPTQKPVALGRYLIRMFTNPGDIVLDNACGSGSFLVAAVLEKRHFIGIEKNKGSFRLKDIPLDFVQVCNERIALAKMNIEIFNQQNDKE